MSINKHSVDKIFENCCSTFRAKNHDYGNSFVDFGTIGIIVRINDKLNRIMTLQKSVKNIGMVSSESIFDNYLDLLNYCIIGLICLDL